MSEEYTCDRHVVGKCFYCGKEFEYTLKAKFLREHPNLIQAIQLYCSPQCENASQREIEQIRLERERQRPKLHEKFCPKCGYVPKNYYAKLKRECPKCATRFTWREKGVDEDVIEGIE